MAKLRDSDFSNAEDKLAALEEERRQLRRKRRIKWSIEAERSREAPPPVPTTPSTIPVEVLDEGAFVHHPATIADLRAVLALLPDAAVDGITRIQLHSGGAYIDERSTDAGAERDPLIGRIGRAIFPDVYAGTFLGTYHTGTGLISLYGYVYSTESLPLPQELCEFYLKLHALKTFIHEVAHHHDVTQRVRRGRWLADRTENVEWYAEKMEFLWMREHVLPFLERVYPSAVAALRDWVSRHGGARLPLDFFAGDDRTTERDGLVRLTFSTSSAFESWILDEKHRAAFPDSWFSFARELHYADEYEKCLEVLDRVLEQDPRHLDSTTLKADTLVHLERYEDAMALADSILSVESARDDAWQVRGRVFEAREQWEALSTNGQSWLAASNAEKVPAAAYL